MKSAVRLALIIVLILLLVGLLPTWPYSSGWALTPAAVSARFC